MIHHNQHLKQKNLPIYICESYNSKESNRKKGNKKKNEASRQSVPIPTEESTPPRNVTYLQKRHRVKNGNDKIRRAYERGDTEQEQEQASADYSNLSFLFFSFRRCNV